ncbi:MAG: ABC transporter permease subunit [Aureliella sp.]
MNRILFRKYIQESWLLFAACCSMLFFFCWSRIWIVAQFELDQFGPLLKQFKAFERFSPVPLEQFLTYAGSIAMGFNEPVLILCIVVWAISRGSDVVSGELGRGTMEMLLAQPITRTKMLAAHATISTIGLALLCVAVYAGTYMGIRTNTVTETNQPNIDIKIPFLPIQLPLPTGEAEKVEVPLTDRVDPQLFLAPVLNLFGFGFFLLSLSSMVSCLDRYRWRTIGIVLAIYVIELLVFLLSRATDFTGWCSNFTFFALYQPDGMVQLIRNHPEERWSLISGVQIAGWEHFFGPLGMTVSFILLGIFFYMIGWLQFRKRDLPAPV